MARATNKLSARSVATTTRQGYHADGAGLYLQVRETKSWVFRYTRDKKSHEMGLGSLSTVSLLEARQSALAQRRVLAAGKDPLEERKAARAGVIGKTWGVCVDDYIASHEATWKNDAQAEQWTNSLLSYGPDRSMQVKDIVTETVMNSLKPIWSTKTETATRVRGRMERILDWARVSGFRTGENPARWKGHLDKLLPAPAKVTKKTHFAAMPYVELPTFMVDLLSRRDKSARAMVFTILTCARTAEVTGMTWDEIDGDLWTIPEERMKAGKIHIVPLCKQAQLLLAPLPKSTAPYDLSENGMLYYLQKTMKKKQYTVHGFRSSFRDWATEQTNYPSEVIEKALAHSIKDKTEAAYRRGHLLDKRRALMDDWAQYLLA